MIAKTSLSGLSKQHWIETYKSVNSTSVYRNQMRRIFDLIRIIFSEDYRKKERGCAFIGTASPQIPI